MLSRRRAALVAAGVLLSVPTPGVTASAAVGFVDGSREVAAVPAPPAHGSVLINEGSRSSRPVGAATVHGVRRGEGGTVVYVSLGFVPGPGADGARPLELRNQAGGGDRFRVSSDWAGMVTLVDPASRQVHTVLVDDAGDCLCSELEAVDDTPGAVSVLWSAFPELPETTTSVDVVLGLGSVVPDVPVEDGLMEPVADSDPVVPLGSGWPEVDEQAVAASFEPAAGTHPLTTAVADERQEVTRRDSSEASSVDLAADVLFEVDSADLSAQAQEVLGRAAEQVGAAAEAGTTLQVVGHTDSDGSATYNQDLSERRAAAVAAALEPLLDVEGLTLEVEGRGEEEPVAEEESEQGKQANRRVSVVLSGADGGS